MITCDLQNDIISIQIKKELNSNYTFSVSCIGRTQAAIGSIINFAGECGNIRGIIQNVSYNKVTNVSYLTGSDALSYNLAKERINITIPQETQTTLQAAAQYVDTSFIAPAVPCYGCGVFSGNKLQFFQRIAASFGLYYIADNSNLTAYTTKTGNNIREDLTSCTVSENEAGKINKLHIQKNVNMPAYSEQLIQNGTSEEQSTELLQNPNAEDSGFSKSAFIDPWTKTLINISIPVNYTVWNKAVSIGNKKQVQIVTMSDSAADPPWILEIWDNDPGTPQAPNAGANKLAEISTTTGIGDLWQSNGQQIARFCRIGRWFPIAGSQPVKDYPHYDGVRAKVLVWDNVTNSGPQPWNTEIASILDGIEDYNIISETMFPDLAVFNSAGIGQRLLDIDRTDAEISANIPFLKSIELMDTFYNIDINRIDNISWSLAAGQFRTEISGEY